VKLLSDLEWLEGFYDRNAGALLKPELNEDIKDLEDILDCLNGMK